MRRCKYCILYQLALIFEVMHSLKDCSDPALIRLRSPASCISCALPPGVHVLCLIPSGLLLVRWASSLDIERPARSAIFTPETSSLPYA